MLFSSIPFLYYFLPVFLIVYFIVPKQAKNVVILLFSLFFYAYGDPKLVLLLIIYILIGYFLGRFINITKGFFHKFIFIISITLCLCPLIYFKYMDFFIDNINRVTGLSIAFLNLALPIGISFYTFQVISYLIDVYRKRIIPQNNIIIFATYVSLFPQLIAGPIVRYTDVERELVSRNISLKAVYSGIVKFVIGLSKKILIANVLGELVDIFLGLDEKTVMFYWIYAIAFSLQIYFDFSAYSDMAIGLGKILGFSFPDNFNYPYISKSITEFWRRWHITLGSWFRDYIYIPLGGNRVGMLKWLRNVIIVWCLTGFWHGASWNFVIWGLYFAFLLVFEKFVTVKIPLIRHIYVIFAVIISFVIFNANGLNGIITDIKGLFHLSNILFTNDVTEYYFRSYRLILGLAIIGVTPLPKHVYKSIYKSFDNKYHMVLDLITDIVLIILLMVCTAFLIDGSFNPFLYFRF